MTMHDEASFEVERAAAVVLAAEAGAIARDRFDSAVRVDAKGSGGDVVTEIDHLAEQWIVHGLRERFPDDRIQAEEAGCIGPAEAERCWLVDPLDGTNNVVLGVPLYGVCIALLQDGRPQVAAIQDSHQGVTSWAVRGRGAYRDAERLAVAQPQDPQVCTLSWVQGYAVSADDPAVLRARRSLARHFKRVLSTWAPYCDWSLVARGRTAGVLAYRNEAEDLHAGVLLATEAGALLTELDGHGFGSSLAIVAPRWATDAIRSALDDDPT